MENDILTRRLAAVVSADVVGYSRLIAFDEEGTIRSLETCRSRMTDMVRDHGGNVIDFVGDNMLAEFKSARDAVEAALEMQEKINEVNKGLPPKQYMRFRIGIHLGDITSDGERIYGEGVNIAARLQSLAEPGGICISEPVHSQVRGKLKLTCRDMGQQQLKNIDQPVRACRIVLSPDFSTETGGPSSNSPPASSPSLAVLPFVNMTSNPDQEYMSDGLTLNIVTGLVKIPGLFLISDTSMTRYRGQKTNPLDVGRDLNVTHVLDGGVQRSNMRVRVTVRLTETASGLQVWAEQFDKSLDDIFALQDEITREVVEALEIRLVSGEPARTVRQALKSPGAIEAYYRGWSALFKSSPEEILEARSWFEETIRLEPRSALGYALAAWTHCQILHLNILPDSDAIMDRGVDLAEKALKLGDTTGLAHLSLAHINLVRHNHDQALKAVENALLDRPNCDASFAVKASILNYLGRPLEAIPLARRSIKLAPVHPAFYPMVLATSAYHGERPEEALAAADQALAIDPENIDALVIKAATLARMGKTEEAGQTVRAIREIRPGFTLNTYAAGQPYKDARTLNRLLDDLRVAGLD